MTSSSSSPRHRLLWKRLALLPPLLFALYLLSDDEYAAVDDPSVRSDPARRRRRRHHLAVWTALRRHPPCLRVYRALSEISLLLACAAGALWIWERNSAVGEESVGALLFGPIEDDGGGGGGGRRSYESMADYDHDDDEAEKAGERRRDEGGGGDGRKGNVGGDEGEEEGAGRPSSSSTEKKKEDDPFDQVWPTVDADDVSPPSSPLPSWNERYPLPPPSPPSSSSVLSASLDLFLSILVSLFFFTISSAEGGKYIDGIDVKDVGLYRKIAGVAAPTFPLALFAGAAIAAVWPWRKRKLFWSVMSLTAGAPFHPVTFRDGFVGDVLTSSVRPLQDVAFTCFYILSGLRGWWSSSYELSDAALPLERSWLLHTAVLPACMVTPLWCRYLQNLRQTYDEKKRWPYLGNALKYFAAAMVGLVGSYDPDAKKNPIWISCFVGATLYQIWWDVFMDWELVVPNVGGIKRGSKSSSGGGQFWPRWLSFPYRLRPNRLYRFKATYRLIFVTNFALRFCWTLTFLPRKYLDKKSGVLMEAFGGEDFQALFASSALASAEIVRRTLWGLLRLELETIKSFPPQAGEEREEEEETWEANANATTTEEDLLRPGSGIPRPEHANVVVPIVSEELKPMSIELSDKSTTMLNGSRTGFLSLNPTLMRHAGTFLNLPMRSDMSESTDLQILTELCLYATAFASLGIVAAAHRQVM